MSYSEREAEKLKNLYLKDPTLKTVSKLSVLFNKPKRSIISKLVKMGIYQPKGYRSKTGELPVTKLELVREMEEMLNVKLIDLDKAPKLTLKTLKNEVKYIMDKIDTLQSRLNEAIDIANDRATIIKTNFKTDGTI